MVVIAATLASNVPTVAEPFTCGEVIEGYAKAQARDDFAPTLFPEGIEAAPFGAAGDTVMALDSVRNLSGELFCRDDGGMKGLVLCADVTAFFDDQFVFDRMYHAGDALLSMIAPGESMGEASDRATRELVKAEVRGDTAERGVADIDALRGIQAEARVYSDAVCLYVSQN